MLNFFKFTDDSATYSAVPKEYGQICKNLCKKIEDETDGCYEPEEYPVAGADLAEAIRGVMSTEGKS